MEDALSLSSNESSASSGFAYVDSGLSATSLDSSHSDSTRPLSPAYSVVSVDSTMELLIYKYGRYINSYSNIYCLPADEEEMERLDLQHEILVEILGEEYSPNVSEVLSSENSAGIKSCIDLGCGPGNWIMDISRSFPHVDTVGVDLVPPRLDANSLPPNLRFEVDDINEGLQHYFGDFDVAHAQLIAFGIHDYHQVMDQLAFVVRPSGLIDVVECDLHVYNVNQQRIIPNKVSDVDVPWWAQYLHLLREAIKAKGGDVDATANLYHWMSRNSRLEKVTLQEYWLPVVPVPTASSNDQRLNLEEKMKRNHIAFLASGRPLLLGSGIPEPFVDLLEQNAIQEIEDREIPQYIRLLRVTARRNLVV